MRELSVSRIDIRGGRPTDPNIQDSCSLCVDKGGVYHPFTLGHIRISFVYD